MSATSRYQALLMSLCDYRFPSEILEDDAVANSAADM